MAGIFPYSYYSQSNTNNNFNGGLNTTSGPLSVDDSQSPDLINIDFNKFGSILKRNGYLNLNSTATSGGTASDGMWWYEYITTGAYVSNLIDITNGKVLQMVGSTLNGTYNDITGSVTVTAGNFFTFTNFLNKCYMTNGHDAPIVWNGSGNAIAIPALGANLYTFTVNSITTNPAVGDYYTNNGSLFTVSYLNDSGTSGSIAGTIIFTGTGAPTTFGTLYKVFVFTVSGVSVTPGVGATYTNNGQTFTVGNANISGGAGTIYCTGTGNPAASGNLTKTGGTGDSTIAFSAVVYGAGDLSISFSLEVLNANITSAKYIAQWNNYIFLANINLNSGTYFPTRVYYSNLQDDSTFPAINWFEISMLDGQPITGMVPLSDRLVVFKERCIYNVFFTGNASSPFQVVISNSPDVGAVAPYSIQEMENGIIFLSYDGFYYYDGNNSNKLSLQIQSTISGLNLGKLGIAKSLKQRNKNRYMCAVTSGNATTNDTVIVWDWVLNAFTLYSGMYPSAMKTIFLNGYQEQIYFSDYAGYTYHMDTGVDDYPLKVQTAISAYYWTNWKDFGDGMLKKAVPNVVIYYQLNTATITFGYSYDFDLGTDYLTTFSTNAINSDYGTAIFGTSMYSGNGVSFIRQDLNGSGRVARFYFSNSNLSETFQIDALSTISNVETNE